MGCSREGFHYSNGALEKILSVIGMAEMLESEGAWTKTDPVDIPSGASGSDTPIILEAPDGSNRVVGLNVAAIYIRKGFSFESLSERFLSQGMGRLAAMTKAFRDYPEARQQFVESHRRKER